ncbi:MAG: thrombospondin type 3 repeat-containing protein [Patescibacteria group bacterium]|nr:thrombospondin type 3 repeat-containing protein [Patescibacteria group bacterium]
MKNHGPLIGLALLAIFTLFFGFFRIKESIQGPFRVPKYENKLTNEEIQSLLAQRDTDKDGLSDVDEVFKYKTSIYLSDSDSDNYPDKEEIEAGSDPLNPKSTPLKKVAEGSKIEEKKELTVEEIKEILIQAGLPKETLDKVDDETLKKLYNETIQETGIDPEELKKQLSSGLGKLDFSKIIAEQQKLINLSITNTPPTNQPFAENLTGFENLDPATIRQLMLSVGADKTTLDQIDDATLKNLFLQAVKEAQK